MKTNRNWVGAALLAGAMGVGLSVQADDSRRLASRSEIRAESEDAFAALPATITLDAIIRDFKPSGESGGHTDFESFTGGNIVTGLVRNELDADGKPVFAAASGMQINSTYKDRNGRIINPSMYDPAMGDTAGSMSPATSNRLSDGSHFAQWYRDVSGVNSSMRVPLVLNRVAGTDKYVFDSATDAPYRARGGFFPIDGELSGNYGSTGHNFSFTTELSTSFVFDRSKNQMFTFSGDDDVWVFIDNRLVLDLGGLHSREEQSLELNRLAWLTDGQAHTLKVFHAERHTNASNFRIETTLVLRRVEMVATSAMYD
jgi:fibro-slime domain-containing protein